MTITEQMIKQFYEAKIKLAQILIDKKNRNKVTAGIENAQFYCDEIYNRLLEMVSRDTPRMIEENMRGLKNSMQYNIANVLANNQIGDLVKAILNAQRVTTYVVGRLNDDAFRNLTLEQVAIINSGGFSIPMAQKFLTETLEKENIPCYVDKLGRTWSMDVYTNMAIRTGSRQSRNAGMLTADDHDLYYVVPIGSTCPVCAVLEGRVYSKSGTSPYYPPLTELYGKIDENGANDLTNSYLTIHPSCRHTLVKWNEDTKTEAEIEEMREKSSFVKHPKDINPQTKKEMEEYRASQREKAKFRGMLNEYHEMQAQGIDVPKNFQTFINNKENDTKKYEEWKAQKQAIKSEVVRPKNSQENNVNQIVNNIVEATQEKPVVEKYKNKTNINDAKKYAKEKLGIEQAFFDKLDLSLANQINASLTDALQYTDKISEQVISVGSWSERNKQMKVELRPHIEKYVKEQLDRMGYEVNKQILERQVNRNINKYVGKVSSDAYAVFIHGEPLVADQNIRNIIKKYNGIFINPKYNNLEGFARSLINDVKLKYHPIGCENLKAIVDHEVGHGLDKVLKLKENRQIKEAYEEFMRMSDEEKGQILSIYAKKNIKEFIAEAYSEYKNNSKPREFARLIGNILGV